MIQVSARIFPIGFLIEVDNANFNPNDFYINGVWERYGNGMVIVGVKESDNDFSATGKTGGNKTHTLSVNEMPSHNHPVVYNPNKKKITLDGGGSQYNLSWGSSGVNDVGLLYADNVGGGQAHNNLQPYTTAYRWKLISYSD